MVLQFVGTMAALYLPSLNADIIDHGVVTGDTGYIVRIGGLMLAVSLVQIVCSIAAVWFSARTAMGFGRDLRAAIFHRVGSFSAREVQHFGAPSLITRETNDVQQVQMLVLMSGTLMVSAPIMMVGGIMMALREDLGLSWLSGGACRCWCSRSASSSRQMVPSFRLMQERIDEVNRLLREQITGVRVVRAFVREPHETARFADANDDLTDVAVRAGRWLAAMFPTVMLVVNVASVGGAVVRRPPGRRRADAGRRADRVPLLPDADPDVGDDGDVHADDDAARSAVCADRITEVLDTESSVVPPAEPVTDAARPAAARASTRVDLHLPRRRRAGAARRLASRPRRGADGRDHRLDRRRQDDAGQPGAAALRRDRRQRCASTGSTYATSSRRRSGRGSGWCRRRPSCSPGRSRDNLRYGKPDATDEEMWEALEIAQARDFVEAMPERLDAAVAQGGTNLSGGQRQRLAIARALIRRPEIYLFDDSFSALDLATDARLRAALRPVTRDATVVIVAQRVSTIRDADLILVLEDGAVVGRGTHDELLETCATYQEIVESQLTAEEVA